MINGGIKGTEGGRAGGAGHSRAFISNGIPWKTQRHNDAAPIHNSDKIDP